MQLSKNFSLPELTRSETAARLGIANTPPPIALAHLTMLCWYVLEPLRTRLGKPILINSGYRSPDLNKAVNGSESSLHRLGRAADIIVPGISSSEVCKAIVAARLPYSELILEFPESTNAGWCHVAVAEPGRTPEARVFTAKQVNGAVKYEKGIA